MDEFDDADDDWLAEVELGPEAVHAQTIHSLDNHKDNKQAINEDVTVPDMFPFPFQPYQIQQQFMRQLYLCLQAGKVGIFESPTGTGKSLSLICGSLKWLQDFHARQKKEVEEAKNQPEGSRDTDWVTAFAKQKEQEEKLFMAKKEQELINKRENRLKKLGSTSKVVRGKRKLVQLEDEFTSLMQSAPVETQNAFSAEMDSIKRQCLDNAAKSADDDDGDLIPDDYESDEDKAHKENDEVEDEEEQSHVTKIYYCSRTHSQLAQFVREIIKSPFGADTRVISLGSRQNLCINENVRKLKAVGLINDRCLELQKKKSKSRPGCPFRKQEFLDDFGDRALLEPCDIEQLVTLGRQFKTCPYYGTRLSIPMAEVVVLPYNTLLHKATREASGVKLAGNIVIIDEAHNLLDTINSVHSVEVTGPQLVKAILQLTWYEQKYRTRLKAKNLMYIKQILFVLTGFLKCLAGSISNPLNDKQRTGVTAPNIHLLTINNFLFKAQVDNLNLFKILTYCRCSQISKKLNGYVDKYRPEQSPPETVAPKQTATTGLSQFLLNISNVDHKPGLETACQKENAPESALKEWSAPVLNSPLMHIESFLLALTASNDDGRVVVNQQVGLNESSIKFLLLNPAIHFADVLKEARGVIVAGGTMQPISEFKDQLFIAAGLKPDRITEFSCGHVIPAENLMAMTLGVGPTGVPLDFTYQSRGQVKLLEELGLLFVDICSVVPGGVVVFFPSYDYEQHVSKYMADTGINKRLEAKKKIFREPKNALQVEQVLSQYASFIQSCRNENLSGPTGAVLMCVVGGKMSEGINFSDDLGRCVIMVGMPYPNIKSPELKEKMDYLNANFPRDERGRSAGQVHYENLCMKAVNQSIGRAIRHKGDYATIILADQRYSRPSIVSSLPQWIYRQLQKHEKFSSAKETVLQFFSGKQH